LAVAWKREAFAEHPSELARKFGQGKVVVV